MAQRGLHLKVFSKERSDSQERLENDSFRYEIFYLNCQTLTQTKADLISLELTNEMILCFAETVLTTENINYLVFENFKNISNYCRSLHKGGGVGIWCHTSINAEPLHIPVKCTEFDFEICGTLLIDKNNKKNRTVILTCYRTPGSDFKFFCDSLTQVLDYIYKPNYQVLLLGDFNRDPLRDCNDYNTLCDILGSYNALQIVNQPTRDKNVLDHVYTNIFSAQCTVVINEFSDHNSVIVKLYSKTTSHSQPQNLIRRIFSENNIKSFYECCQREDWTSVLQETEVDQAFNKFHNIILHYFNINFPLKKVTIRNSPNRWVNMQIIRSSAELKELNKLKQRFPELNEFYKMKKKEHSKLVTASKKAYYQNTNLCF